MEKDEEDMYIAQENESRGFNLLKADNELYIDDSDVPHTVINAKRVRLPRNGEDWEILEDGDVVLVLKGTRFTKSEKEFLRTVDGMKFLISEYKSGAKSVVKIKAKMKAFV